MNKNDYLIFKTIFDQIPISTQIFTPDGETIMVNDAWERLWHISFRKLKKYNILSDKQLVDEGVMPIIKNGYTGKPVTIPAIKYIPEKTVQVKNAVPFRWVEAKMYPILDENKKLTHIVLQHEDITQRRIAEETKSRLAAIIESSDDAIISKNLDGIITSWNRAAEKLFGYSQKEAVGKHITLVIPKHLHSQEEIIISKIKQAKHIDHFETERVKKDGTYVMVSLSISPIKDGSGIIIGASKIVRNITETKRSEKALRESEERLRFALRAGKIGVWDWDLIENKLSWTENVYKIHGVQRKTFTVSLDSFRELVHADDVARVEAAITDTVQNRKPFAIEFRVVTPSGETRWVETSAMYWTDDKNTVIRLLGATRDISQQKKLEQDKNDFLSMASHELKTPLTSMKLYIELLSNHMHDSSPEKSGKYLQRIHEQASRLTELTTDLLDVSRIETGKMRLRRETFLLNDLVHETVESIQLPSLSHMIEVTFTENVSVHADRYRLYQVIANFLTNAIKYSPKGKKIIVAIKKEKNSVTVSVTDQGIGISKEEQKKVFDKLYQVTNSKEKIFPGLGFGLYISKEIIERHKGIISVESTQGKGSTFYFILPLE